MVESQQQALGLLLVSSAVFLYISFPILLTVGAISGAHGPPPPAAWRLAQRPTRTKASNKHPPRPALIVPRSKFCLCWCAAAVPGRRAATAAPLPQHSFLDQSRSLHRHSSGLRAACDPRNHTLRAANQKARSTQDAVLLRAAWKGVACLSLQEWGHYGVSTEMLEATMKPTGAVGALHVLRFAGILAEFADLVSLCVSVGVELKRGSKP